MTDAKYPVFQKFIDFFTKEQLKVYKKGDMILYAGDVPSGIFYIQSGHVKAYSLSDKGEEKIHMLYKENEIFPLIWTFKKSQNNLFYQAIDTVTVRMVEEKLFHEFLHKDPETMHAIAHRLIDIIDIFSDRVENLQFAKSYNRLVARLLFLAKRFGKPFGNTVTLEAPITHLDIANTISMTRETVNRDMKILLDKQLISQKNHLITIKNIELLKKELSEN